MAVDRRILSHQHVDIGHRDFVPALVQHLGDLGRVDDPREVDAPVGSIVNAVSPQPCTARHVVGMFLPNALLKALAQVKALWPEVSAVASHQITREWREYERMSTTVLSAFVQPMRRDRWSWSLPSRASSATTPR